MQIDRQITYCLLLAIVAVIGCDHPSHPKLSTAAASFVQQTNSLGKSLDAGEQGKVHLPSTDAEQLLLLPHGHSVADLEDFMPGLPPATVKRLAAISANDHVSPALVWFIDGEIVSICPANFEVATNLTPRLWDADVANTIIVRKEAGSPNGFLSLEFAN